MHSKFIRKTKKQPLNVQIKVMLIHCPLVLSTAVVPAEGGSVQALRAAAETEALHTRRMVVHNRAAAVLAAAQGVRAHTAAG
jgi:hypothetical protein